MTWIATFQPWHWLVAGIILLGLETLGIGGFLIGTAIACFVQSLIVFFAPDLHWAFQIVVFAVNSIVFTFLYWKVFKPFNTKTDQPTLNDRAAQMIGRKTVIDADMPHGEGKIMFGDTYWRVQSESPLQNGDAVTVTGAEGMILKVQQL